jgi:Predicted hydrolases or acyltransferases (alpha/beta hydrolase superfamily)
VTTKEAHYIERSALVAGTRMHYVESSAVSPSANREILVLIHGSLCDYRYWRWQIADLSPDFHIAAPSLPGCWPEAMTAEADPSVYSMGRHIDAIAELCEQLSAGGRVHLLGHSRGAQVALEVAMTYPERISKLILADPGFPFSDEAATVPVHRQIAERLGHMDLDDVLQEFVDAVNGPGSWKRTVRWFKDMTRANAWTLIPQVKDIERSIDPHRVKTDLQSPVLLIGGEQSPPRYANRIERLQSLLPQAVRVTVPRAAHGMNLANAPFFNTVLRQYLSPYFDGSLPTTPST